MKKSHRIALIALAALLIVLSGAAFRLYRQVFGPAVRLYDSQTTFLYIPTGSSYEDVAAIVREMGIIARYSVFTKIATYKGYDKAVKAGRYKLTEGMSINSLVNLLRSGRQTPVDVVFNNVRTAAQLAGRIARQIEADSASLYHLLTDSVYLSALNVQPHEIANLFIPNTYELYWNTDADKFIRRMQREAEKFWNEQRMNALSKIELTRKQAVTLASIVEMETQQNSEKPRMAGVYLNRLHRGMLLQADPTLVFASGDFTLRRVLNKHKIIDSPYNTYRYAGLPPGPICIPSVASIDAVLNAEAHDYLYFCAKEDFSGYHSFAHTYAEHLSNARRYQMALNKLKIRN